MGTEVVAAVVVVVVGVVCRGADGEKGEERRRACNDEGRERWRERGENPASVAHCSGQFLEQTKRRFFSFLDSMK